MTVIGITGTDGKTTTTALLYEVLNKANVKAGMVSTIGAEYLGKKLSVGLHTTTPDARVLQGLLWQMKRAGVTHVVLEVTAHALDQHRVLGCNFQIGVLTNISQDHLDDFVTMDRYIGAKKALFRNIKYAVLNKDDPYYEQFKLGQHVVAYTKTRLQHIGPALAGDYNKYNIGAVESVSQLLKIDTAAVGAVVREFAGVPGRREEVRNDRGLRLVVDFAHTPNGLKQLLISLKQELSKNGKLILVFGCTGERDKSKRPVMGSVATEYADRVIVTTDDLYGESQDRIYADIVRDVDLNQIVREDDRDLAISKAVKMAKKGDIVVATGMGHEKTQRIGDREIERSDRQAFLAALH